MPERSTVKKAKRDLRQGKRPTTAAGEFVREEIHHIRRGKHGAKSTQQAIAIGLSKARRAGVPLKPRRSSKAKSKTRRSAANPRRAGRSSPKRKAAASRALKRAPRRVASKRALSAYARRIAVRRKRSRR